MEQFAARLSQSGFEGEIENSLAVRQEYSHDASLFEILPELVIFPKSEADLQKAVAAINLLKGQIPSLSLTARSGGTCMSGGAVNDSVIIDFTRYMNKIEDVQDFSARAQPGVFYRDFEKATLAKDALLPTFPASRELAA